MTRPPLFHLDWTMNHRFYFLSKVPCLQPFQKSFSMVGSPEASVSPSVSGRVQGDLLSSAWSGRSSSPQPAWKCQLLFSPSQLGCTSCQVLPRAPTSWEGEAELTFSLEKGWACPSSAHDPLKGSQLEFARELLLATF